ncbi:MAG: flagellar hook-associated protein 3 [Dethiosulfovibrio peptidovorans]|nr:MAG: flagellar hook-associated protein 3 [Dethiosulfovibrio peptidovorans]
MRRISNPMMHTGMLTDMHRNLRRLMLLNKQTNTGKLHHKPSDAPIDVTREISLSTTIFENVQYVRNMRDGLTWLKNTDTALDQIGEQIDSVRALAVRAGDGALENSEMEAIAQELTQLQEAMRQTANYSVEGRFILSGAHTSIPPFQRDALGHVVYKGNDYRVQFEMERGIVSDVSLTGREVFPQYYDQYSVQSVDLPQNFQWQGRNEIIRFNVGERSVKVRIPEDAWLDNNRDSIDAGDYNRFRDPGEMDSLTLDEIAQIIEKSVNMGDAGKLITVRVHTDNATETQRLEIRSHTGEPIAINSWPETDNMPMNQAVESPVVDDTAGYVLASDGSIDVILSNSDKVLSIAFQAGDSLDDMATKISAEDGVEARVLGRGTANARLVVIASEPGVRVDVTPNDGATGVFGTDALASSPVLESKDHSHVGLMELLGMETSLQSTEFNPGVNVASGLSNTNKVHWYIQAGENKAEMLVNAGPDMTMESLAQELRSVAGDWLEVIVHTDPGDDVGGPTLSDNTDNVENGTQKLILRTKDGSPVSVMDLSPTLGQPNTTLAQTMGLSTAVYATSGGTFPLDSSATPVLDPYMPARMTVSVGPRDYEVKLYRDDVLTGGGVDANKLAKEIQRQVGKGPDGKDLIQFRELPVDASGTRVAMFASSGEPLMFVDQPFGDPAVRDFSAGLALQSGIATGIQGTAVNESTSVTAGGVFRIETPGRSVAISVGVGDTMKDVAQKIKKYAGSWLNVAYVDTDPGVVGDVRLSLLARDGSAVNVVDLEPAAMSSGGSGAAEVFGISTGIRGAALPAAAVVDISADHTLTVRVDGYEHTIDLRLLDKNGDGQLTFSVDPTLDELGNLDELINARFQGQDIKAEYYTDSSGDRHLMIVSPQGYNVEILNGPTNALFGSDPVTTTSRGGVVPYNQVVTRRTGADHHRVDFFGMMEDLVDAVRGQDREGISTLLSDIDAQIDALLGRRTEEGALVKRYQGSSDRLTQNNGNYTELLGSIGDTDFGKAAMEFMSAQAIYQAGLATIARIIQPTLVDFLR